jgi:hypothetical protein
VVGSVALKWMAHTQTELRTGSKSGAGSRWSHNTTHGEAKAHIKVDCVRIVKMAIVLPEAYIMPEEATLVLRVPRYHDSFLATMV